MTRTDEVPIRLRLAYVATARQRGRQLDEHLVYEPLDLAVAVADRDAAETVATVRFRPEGWHARELPGTVDVEYLLVDGTLMRPVLGPDWAPIAPGDAWAAFGGPWDDCPIPTRSGLLLTVDASAATARDGGGLKDFGDDDRRDSLAALTALVASMRCVGGTLYRPCPPPRWDVVDDGRQISIRATVPDLHHRRFRSGDPRSAPDGFAIDASVDLDRARRAVASVAGKEARVTGSISSDLLPDPSRSDADALRALGANVRNSLSHAHWNAVSPQRKLRYAQMEEASRAFASGEAGMEEAMATAVGAAQWALRDEGTVAANERHWVPGQVATASLGFLAAVAANATVPVLDMEDDEDVRASFAP